MPKKIITLDTLSEFKDQCDLNYAPIGSGDGVPIFKITAGGYVDADADLDAINAGGWYFYLTGPSTTVDVAAGSYVHFNNIDLYAANFRYSGSFQINEGPVLCGALKSGSSTIFVPFKITNKLMPIYYSGTSSSGNCHITEVLDITKANTAAGLWCYIGGPIYDVHSFTFRNYATQIAIEDDDSARGFSREIADAPTLAHFYTPSGGSMTVKLYMNDMPSIPLCYITSYSGNVCDLDGYIDISKASTSAGTYVFFVGNTGPTDIVFFHMKNGDYIYLNDGSGDKAFTPEQGVLYKMHVYRGPYTYYTGVIEEVGGGSSSSVYQFQVSSSSGTYWFARETASFNSGSSSITQSTDPFDWIKSDGSRVTTPILKMLDTQDPVMKIGNLLAPNGTFNESQLQGAAIFVAGNNSPNQMVFGRWYGRFSYVYNEYEIFVDRMTQNWLWNVGAMTTETRIILL